MQKGDTCEVTFPADCQGDGTHVGEACVGAPLSSLETLVAVHPHTVPTVGPSRLADDLLKVGLHVKRNVLSEFIFYCKTFIKLNLMNMKHIG